MDLMNDDYSQSCGFYVFPIMEMKYVREETFNNFGNKLSPKTVVHNWYVLLDLFLT